MTARPVSGNGVATLPDTINVSQAAGPADPLYVAQGQDTWRTLGQGRGQDGNTYDLATSKLGELLTGAGPNLILNEPVRMNGASVPAYPIRVDNDGYQTAMLVITGTAPNQGCGLQITVDGQNWMYINMANINTGSNDVTTLQYGSATPYVASIPPCRAIRVMYNATAVPTNTAVQLALSRTPFTNYVQTRINIAQVTDNSTYGNSSGLQQLLVGGVDATKKTRVLAADGTVNAKSQGQVNNASGAALNIPFFGHVLSTAITRVQPQQYIDNQPVALQADTRGHLSVNFDEMRRNQEQQIVLQQAAAMQQLDPNWGFEVR